MDLDKRLEVTKTWIARFEEDIRQHPTDPPPNIQAPIHQACKDAMEAQLSDLRAEAEQLRRLITNRDLASNYE